MPVDFPFFGLYTFLIASRSCKVTRRHSISRLAEVIMLYAKDSICGEQLQSERYFLRSCSLYECVEPKIRRDQWGCFYEEILCFWTDICSFMCKKSHVLLLGMRIVYVSRRSWVFWINEWHFLKFFVYTDGARHYQVLGAQRKVKLVVMTSSSSSWNQMLRDQRDWFIHEHLKSFF